MDETANLEDEERYSLQYGHAIDAFFRRCVDAELSDPRWRSDYPDLIAELQATDLYPRRSIRLPGRIVFAIAGRPDLPDEYFISPDGSQIGVIERNKTLRGESAPEKWGWRLVSAQEAMIHCGAYSLYRASEGSIAGCNEKEL
jgi:hypothetical protein